MNVTYDLYTLSLSLYFGYFNVNVTYMCCEGH
jgi:hypothetical protein